MSVVASSIDVRVATSIDDPDLRRLLRENPMRGEISVSLEREPDVFLAGSTEGERHHTIVARDDCQGRAVAWQPVGLQGFLRRPRRWDIGQMRVDSRVRRAGRLLERLRR